MRNKKHTRTLSLLLAAVLLVGQLGATAYAEGPPNAGGLCEHHTAHDDTCGYVEAIPGHDCEHEHTSDCYTDELICGLDEDAERTASGSDAGHQHEQECHALDCQHKHDTDCGYIEATPGTPCGYVCNQCGGEPDKDSGTISGNNPPTPVETAPGTVEPGGTTVTVTAFDELDESVKYQTVPAGTTLDGLTLPVTLDASGYTVADDTEPISEPLTVTGVTWEPDSPWDESAEQGSYAFTPVLPAGYSLVDGVALPEIYVRIGGMAVTLKAQRDVLTVTFSSNGSGGTSMDDNDMKKAIETALASLPTGSDKTTITTIEVTGGVTEITDYNWRYLIQLYCNGQGWDNLTALDLSGMTNLTAVRDGASGIKYMRDQLRTLTLTTSLKEIGDYAFYMCNVLKLNELPEKLTQIGKYAFNGCTGITLNELPGDLTQIGYAAFNGCTGITLNELPGDLTQIGGYAFYDCTDITLNELPGGLTQIEKYAFDSCTGITLNELPSGLTKIGKAAFNGCTGITLNELPDGLTEIGSGAFYGCTGLNNIIMEPTAAPTIYRDTFTGTSSGLTFYVPKNGTGYDSGGWENLNKIEYSPVTSISLPATLELRPNGSGTLTAIFTPNDATFKEIIWESSDTNIVTVDQDGNVTAVSNGTATITATSRQGGKTAVCAVTVKPISTDATLKSLSLSGVTLTPNFDPAITSYTASVDNNMSTITITAEANDTNATMTGDGVKTLNVGDNTFTVTVTAEDSFTMKSYTINITRATSADATLKSLSLSSGTLTPAFAPTITSYTAAVGNNVSSVNITAEANGTNATMTGDGTKTLNVGDNPFTITVTAEDGSTKSYTISITRASYSGGGGSSDDDSSDNNNHIITTPQPPKPDNPALAVIELPVTVEGGTATGKLDDGHTAAAITEAQRDAKANVGGIAVQYDAKTSKTYDGFSIVIRRATLDRLIAAKVKYLTLNTGIVDLTLDLAALQEIQKQSSGDITLTATRETGLTGDALAAVGKRPAYRLTVSYIGKDGKTATVQNFGAGRVTVGLAYKPAATEQTGSLYLVYSKDGKGAEWLYQSSYDSTSSNVIGSTGHFSLFGVGYKPAPAFTDTVNHWAKTDIDFVASRGLLTGTGDTTFTPDGTITRGMFVTALGRLAGIDPAAYPSSSRFTDVPANAYYAPYVEWTAGKGIVGGTGENSFSPDAAITREQMAVIMQRYADKLGYTLPVAREAEIFADEGQITSGMKNAVQAIQQAGIMNGKDGHRFGPKDTATRAEAAAVLRRFVEIVIDPAAAGGWGQNDAGRWLYYENSKPVTGWKLIESKWYYFDAAGLMEYGGWKEIGGKWYYFYPDGAMAANTTIDGYEIGPDGKRKEKED